MGREDEIKLIAYKIWEEEGCVDGPDCEHWFRAEMLWEQQPKQEGVTKSSEIGPGKTTKATARKKKS